MKKIMTLPVSLQEYFAEVAGLSRFTSRFFKNVHKRPWEISETIRQSYLIGYQSLGLVLITSFIMGVVLTIQSRPTLAHFGAESWLPGMVAVSIVREIGPIITALICAGKVGSGIGAELASMKVTEQIDAMEVSGINPFKYIVITRVVAATLMLPVLVVFADFIGLVGSFVGVNLQGDVGVRLYFSQAIAAVDFIDVFPAFVKSFFFGLAIGIISCYKGYTSNKGTEGVGLSANSAVVLSLLCVFLIDLVAVQLASFFE